MSSNPRERADVGPVQRVEAHPGSQYPLEVVAHLTGASRRSILVYCKSGLIHPAADPDAEGFTFDDEAVYSIRQIEQLRAVHGINLAGIRMIFDLLRELRHLREEMRFMRM